jgi:hypothetical protein
VGPSGSASRKTTMEIIDVTHESLSFDDPDDHGRELIIHKP